MAQTMTPSELITDGQVGDIKELLGPVLVKLEIQKELVQQVLMNPNQSNSMITEMAVVVRRYTEAISNMIVRTANVNRKRKPFEAFEATGRKVCGDRKVVDAISKGTGNRAETVFFRLDLKDRGGYISNDDLLKEFHLRGLEPEHPINLAAVNEADPSLADEKPNATIWKDADGKWCFALFVRWDDGRGVTVNRDHGRWSDDYLFAGRRK